MVLGSLQQCIDGSVGRFLRGKLEAQILQLRFARGIRRDCCWQLREALPGLLV